MSFSDDVRNYCKVNYVDSARKKGERTVTIISGDVHSALHFSNKYPLVCSALGSDKFNNLCHLKRLSVEGPLNGVSTIFVFELL
jgi:5-methylcytosine-specific restriction protein B